MRLNNRWATGLASSSMKTVSFAIALVLAVFSSVVSCADGKGKSEGEVKVEIERSSVVTGTQVTYSLTAALLEGTGIETVNIPEGGRRLSGLKNYLDRRSDRFKETFERATAVVGFSNVIHSDPLYRFARQANIHLIYVDAAQPWRFDAAGVTLIDQPVNTVFWGDRETEKDKKSLQAQSNYFWLSVSNAIRMADLIGSDLVRVFPSQSDLIRQNLQSLKSELQTLNRTSQEQLLSAQDITVFALASEFVDLTNDLGLFVDGYFLKQDINWTEKDLAALTQRLSSREIRVVIHKWEPSEAIKAAISAAGAKLVVLNTGDLGITADRKLVSDGYQQILRSNIKTLVESLF